MAFCHGNGPDHCCFTTDGVCRYLEENTIPGRRWVCNLRRILGSWQAVHGDPGYIKYVQPLWDSRGGGSCGDWPVTGEKCAACGKVG